MLAEGTIAVKQGATVGCLAGNHIQAIYTQANRYALYLLAAAALIIRHRLRRARHDTGGGESGTETDDARA
jgi:hypothetical protein